MPKKMGINSKAAESRDRKAATKKSVTEKAAKEAEDRLWQDDDKNLAKKKAKKEEEERKKQEQLRKKAEAKVLLEQEVASVKVQGKPSIQKVNRVQIQQELEKRNRAVETINAPVSRVVVADELPLEENLNRAMAETDVASTVDQAIAVLNINDNIDDNHPEKRMKAAFKAFEAENMNQIKLENPTLRMSQWKQILTKMWNKSPDNPMNQRV